MYPASWQTKKGGIDHRIAARESRAQTRPNDRIPGSPPRAKTPLGWRSGSADAFATVGKFRNRNAETLAFDSLMAVAVG